MYPLGIIYVLLTPLSHYMVSPTSGDVTLCSDLVSPTVSLLNRWQFTNTATVENLLKSLHAIERGDCANLLEAQCNVILIECLTTV